MYNTSTATITPERRRKLRRSLSESTKRHAYIDLESMTDAMVSELGKQYRTEGDFTEEYIPWVQLTRAIASILNDRTK